MSLTAFESWGEPESPVISVGMNVDERYCREEGPPLHLFVDGQDMGVFDWEILREEKTEEHIGAVDYIESETELRAKLIMPAVELVIANCMHSIHPQLDTIEFPDDDVPLAA